MIQKLGAQLGKNAINKSKHKKRLEQLPEPLAKKS
jgi:hypothetical protein